MSKTYSKTRTLVECALMIALGTVLANIKIFEMPNGGSITLLSMLPFILVSYRHGTKWDRSRAFSTACRRWCWASTRPRLPACCRWSV